MKSRSTIDWFPYQVLVVLVILIISTAISIYYDLLIPSLLLALTTIITALVLLGRLFAPNYLEKSILEYIRKNGNQLNMKKVEEFFIINSDNNKEAGIQTTNEILGRLEKKQKIVIDNNIVKLSV